jgi:hypothetical protein
MKNVVNTIIILDYEFSVRDRYMVWADDNYSLTAHFSKINLFIYLFFGLLDFI